ncbi:hypothetical protein IE53DRAFT_37772 [Violaceomyces palustris]|uniref:Uncharacterized protein n=1 Tax=Violaceomyces palustris TaxID=1673888 RepID=A0ACD0P144_9BASI|nr:hypothetical protein IE53DRAFT_37772 [Violaceomyces palustris]
MDRASFYTNSAYPSSNSAPKVSTSKDEHIEPSLDGSQSGPASSRILAPIRMSTSPKESESFRFPPIEQITDSSSFRDPRGSSSRKAYWEPPIYRSRNGHYTSAYSQGEDQGRAPITPTTMLPASGPLQHPYPAHHLSHRRASETASLPQPLKPHQQRRTATSEESSVGGPIKRPRVSLACLACRNRKSRCDGTRPTCKSCSQMRIECKWPEVDFRRAKAGDERRKARKPSLSGPSDPKTYEAQDHGSTHSHQSHSHSQSESEQAQASSQPYLRPYSRSRSSSPSGYPRDRSAVSATQSALSISALILTQPLHSLSRHGSSGDFLDARHDRRYRPLMKHSSYSRLPNVRDEFLSSSGKSISPNPREREYFDELTSGRKYGRESRPPMPASSFSNSSGSTAHSTAFNFSSSSSATTTTSASPGVYPYSQMEGRDPGNSPSANALILMYLEKAASLAAKATRGALSISGHAESFAGTKRRREAEDAREGSPKRGKELIDGALDFDWQSLGIRGAAVSSSLLSGISGSTGFVELLEDGKNQLTRLHFFRTAKEGTSRKLERVALPANLPASVKKILIDSQAESGQDAAVKVSSLELDLAAVVKIPQHVTAPFNSSDEVLQIGGRKASSLFQGKLPRSDLLSELLTLFFSHLGDHFPFIERCEVERKILDGEASLISLNAMCSLGCRFSNHPELKMLLGDGLDQDPFMSQAKAMVSSVIASPSRGAIQGLILMAWAEFCSPSRSASWMFSGMASRMALDLQLHLGNDQDLEISAEQRYSDCLLFWSVYMLDRVIAISYGRPVSIKEGEISAPLPPTMAGGQPFVFAYAVQQMRLYGRLSDTISTPSRSYSKEMGYDDDRARELDNLEANLVNAYESMPSELVFNSTNFKSAIEQGQAGIFCQMHLWHHAALISRYLLSPAARIEAASFDLLRESAREIGEIATLAEALDRTSLIACPLTSHAYFLSACVSLPEYNHLISLAEARDESASPLSPNHESRIKASNQPATRSSRLLFNAAKSNINRCLGALDEQAKYWKGAKRMSEILTPIFRAKDASSPDVDEINSSSSNPTLDRSIFVQIDQIKVLRILTKPVADSLRTDAKPLPSSDIHVEKITSAEQLKPFFFFE